MGLLSSEISKTTTERPLAIWSDFEASSALRKRLEHISAAMLHNTIFCAFYECAYSVSVLCLAQVMRQNARLSCTWLYLQATGMVGWLALTAIPLPYLTRLQHAEAPACPKAGLLNKHMQLASLDLHISIPSVIVFGQCLKQAQRFSHFFMFFLLWSTNPGILPSSLPIKRKEQSQPLPWWIT